MFIIFISFYIKCAVAKFAQEQIAPLVREMEANGKLDEALLKALFDNGLMGIEIPEEVFCSFLEKEQ